MSAGFIFYKPIMPKGESKRRRIYEIKNYHRNGASGCLGEVIRLFDRDIDEQFLDWGFSNQVSVFSKAYVETITVQAEASYRDSMVEVWANGKPKGSLYIPARDPNYVVTIRETISSLEFRSVSGGRVNIIQVTGMGVQGSSASGRPSLGAGYNANEVTEVASEVKRLINEMKKSMTPKQQDQYIMPIRKSATELYAIASSNSPYGVQVYRALTKLLTQLNNAEAFLDNHIETDNGEDVVTDITVVKERIKKMLY